MRLKIISLPIGLFAALVAVLLIVGLAILVPGPDVPTKFYALASLTGFLLIGFAFIIVPGILATEHRWIHVAFAAAPMLSLFLFITYLLFPLLDCSQDSCAESVETILFLFFIGLAFGICPTLLATALLAYPLYLALKRMNALTSYTILPAAFLIGIITMYTFTVILQFPDIRIESAEFVDIILPAGLSAAIGGVVFCWLTIWRRQEVNGASNGSN